MSSHDRLDELAKDQALFDSIAFQIDERHGPAWGLGRAQPNCHCPAQADLSHSLGGNQTKDTAPTARVMSSTEDGSRISSTTSSRALGKTPERTGR